MKKTDKDSEPDFTFVITSEMIDEAVKALKIVDRDYENRGALLRSKRASCLANVIIRSRYKYSLPELSSRQMAVAQKIFRGVIIKLKGDNTRARRKQERAEVSARRHEALRRQELTESLYRHENANQLPPDYSYYFSIHALEEAVRICNARHDHLLRDP